MRHAVVKREGFTALHPVQSLHLRDADKGIEERSVVVVAVCIEDRHTCKQFRNLLEPVVRILVVLIARPKRDVPRMQQELGLLTLCRAPKRLRCVKEMRIRNGHEMERLRRLLQCAERRLCTALLSGADRVGILRVR